MKRVHNSDQESLGIVRRALGNHCCFCTPRCMVYGVRNDATCVPSLDYLQWVGQAIQSRRRSPLVQGFHSRICGRRGDSIPLLGAWGILVHISPHHYNSVDATGIRGDFGRHPSRSYTNEAYDPWLLWCHPWRPRSSWSMRNVQLLNPCRFLPSTCIEGRWFWGRACSRFRPVCVLSLHRPRKWSGWGRSWACPRLLGFALGDRVLTVVETLFGE